MWAYIDETGHTGSNIFDESQPNFFSAALVTKTNFDILAKSEFSEILDKLSVTELHANELGVHKLVDIAPCILKIIKKHNCNFVISIVKKRNIISSKLVDTFLDPGINPSVPQHVYLLKPLRLILVFKFTAILDDQIENDFWNVLMSRDLNESKLLLRKVIDSLKSNIDLIPDIRSRKIIGNALNWASSNIDVFDILGGSKRFNRFHIPNMIGFPSVLEGIQMLSDKWRKQVKFIYHDKQQQFATNLKQVHKAFSEASRDPLTLPGGEILKLSFAPDSEFVIIDSSQSIGIQLVDCILWIFKNRYEMHTMPIELINFLKEVDKRCYISEFSLNNMDKILRETFTKVEKSNLTEEQINEAQKMINHFNLQAKNE